MRFWGKRREEVLYDNEDFFFEDIVEDVPEDEADTQSYEHEFEMEHFLDGFHQEKQGNRVYKSFARISKLLAVILVAVVLGIIILIVSDKAENDVPTAGDAGKEEDINVVETVTESVENSSEVEEGGLADGDVTDDIPGDAVTEDATGDGTVGVPMSEIWTLEEPVSGTVDMEFEPISDIVTAKDISYLRSAPDTHDVFNVLKQLGNGQEATRTGINHETGWSRLQYENETVYAVSAYLTTDMDFVPAADDNDPNRVPIQDGTLMVFVDCDDYITPNEYVNLRTEPSTVGGSDTVAAKIYQGVSVHRTGLSPDGGWSRIEYEDQVLYVVSSYMSKTE